MAVHLTTFSIVGRCPRSGMLGVAVSTAVPAVGALCPFVKAGVGAVSTQSWVNPYLAIEALERMEQGVSGPEALEQVLANDDAAELRQIGVVDAHGRSASWSGEGCTPWFGHITEANFAVQGNMLVGEATLTAMADAFERSDAQDLAERLLLALEAGNAAGGDKRGKQSAALRVHHSEDYPWLDLRVDEHDQPVAELRRVATIARLQLLPFVEGMPKRGQPASGLPESVTEMLLASPADRPRGSRAGAATSGADSAVDPYRDVLGLEVGPERLAHDLSAFSEILAELQRLRSLDLTALHPAVVFDPAGGANPKPKPRNR